MEGAQVKKSFNKDNFNFLEILGDGSSGIVYKAQEKATGMIYALKQINKEQIEEKELNKILLLREIATTDLQLQHENIVNQSYEGETTDAYYFKIEYCNKGSLVTYLNAHTFIIGNEEFAIKMIKDIISGYNFIHSKNIIHRDIKLDNILVHMMPDNTLKAKIGDFGFSKICKSPSEVMSTSKLGSVLYVAPEIIEGVTYNYRCDIFSLGIALYVMICGYFPFKESSAVALYHKYINHNIKLDLSNKSLSQYTIYFITRCLQCSPDDRFTMDELAKNELITQPYMFLKANSVSNVKLELDIHKKPAPVVQANVFN